VFFVIAVIAIVATLSLVTRATGTKIQAPLESMSLTARPCTFKECFASNCNHDVAPYTCLFHNGGPHGGCSPTPWYPTTCDDQCSLTDCDKLEIPDDVSTCENRKCTSSWCEGGQVCPKDAPFQCVDGSGRFGCSMDALHWTLRVGTNVCTDCCDTTTCDK
jgi:hypothetical protein